MAIRVGIVGLGMMAVYDPRGNRTREYGTGSGVVQATQSPWNPKGIGVCENVVWMISGPDKAGARSAVEALISQYGGFQYAFAAVVADGEVIRVPGLLNQAMITWGRFQPRWLVRAVSGFTARNSFMMGGDRER